MTKEDFKNAYDAIEKEIDSYYDKIRELQKKYSELIKEYETDETAKYEKYVGKRVIITSVYKDWTTQEPFSKVIKAYFLGLSWDGIHFKCLLGKVNYDGERSKNNVPSWDCPYINDVARIEIDEPQGID